MQRSCEQLHEEYEDELADALDAEGRTVMERGRLGPRPGLDAPYTSLVGHICNDVAGWCGEEN